MPGAGVSPGAVTAPVTALSQPLSVTAPRPGPSPPRRTDQHGPPKMAAPEVKLGVGRPRQGERDEGGAAELLREPGCPRGLGGARAARSGRGAGSRAG